MLVLAIFTVNGLQLKLGKDQANHHPFSMEFHSHLLQQMHKLRMNDSEALDKIGDFSSFCNAIQKRLSKDQVILGDDVYDLSYVL